MNNPPHQQRWAILAHLLRPQGRKGELLAELLTDFPERFTERRRVFLQRATPQPNNAAPPAEYTLEAHWLPMGKNAGRVVLKFAGVDSINDAEQLKGFDVLIPIEERATLEEDAAYISDLIGCTVFNGSHPVGTIEDIAFPTATPQEPSDANAVPLLVVRGGHGREYLIPFAKIWLRTLDIASQRVEMQLPEGLLEINAPVTDEEKRLAQTSSAS
jgi:16S rRNA processing protein RimM